MLSVRIQGARSAHARYRPSRLERWTPSLRLLLLRLFLASDPFEKLPAFGPLGMTFDKSLG